MHARRSPNQRFCSCCRQSRNPQAMLFIDSCFSVWWKSTTKCQRSRLDSWSDLLWFRKQNGRSQEESWIIRFSVRFWFKVGIFKSTAMTPKRGTQRCSVVLCPLFPALGRFPARPHRTPAPHPNNTTSTTPTWARARLWMNEEIQTSLLSSFDVEHWALSVYRRAPPPTPQAAIKTFTRGGGKKIKTNICTRSNFPKPTNLTMLK